MADRITKKEFNEFLDGFNKEPGEYTDQEMYEIGMKYKSLPTSEKRWNELATTLGAKDKDGNQKSGETFRIWLKDKQLAAGTLEKNPKVLSDKTVEELEFDDFKEETAAIKRDLYIQQTKTRDTWNAYRRTLRDEARIQSLKDTIKEAVSELKELPKARYEGEERTDNEAILLFSDLHIGVQVDDFYNSYNVNEARRRVDKLVKDTVALCKRNHVRRLNFLNLGDAIHGIIHVTARLEEELDVVQQVMVASEIIADALNELQEAAPEVIYRSCTDNHARVMADLKQQKEKENFGKLIDFYLKERLKGTRIRFEESPLNEEIGMFELLNGKTVVFSHGHHDSINQSMQSMVGATHKYIDYVLMGHYHSPKQKVFEGCNVIVNSSIVGPEQYAFSKRLFGKASQKLLIFEGINLYNMDIYLN